MARVRKIITVTVTSLAIAAGFISSSTPASAWCNGWGCGGGGWGGPGPVAAGVVGGLALGAIAAGAVAPQPYYRTCLVRQPVYDDYGRFIGNQRVRVAC